MSEVVVLSSVEEKTPLLATVAGLIETAYANIGGHCKLTDLDELLNRTGIWRLFKDGGEIVMAIIYKDSAFGPKHVAIGHNGGSGKSKIRELIRIHLQRKDSWAEVSGASARVWIAAGFPVVPAKYAQRLLNKDIEVVDDFRYSRRIGEGVYTKVIVGFPQGLNKGKRLLPEEAQSLIRALAA